MIRLVSERSEREIAIAELGEALAELAAQMMRLSAGGGSTARWIEALGMVVGRFDRVVDGQPFGISLFDLRKALKFSRSEMKVLPIDREIDSIATHALRLVASRLEGNDVQERFSEGKLKEAIRHLEEAREERYGEWTQRPPGAFSEVDWTDYSLTAPMIAALEYLSEPDEKAPRRKRPPGASTMRALLGREMIERGEGPMGYMLTARGREARGRGCAPE